MSSGGCPVEDRAGGASGRAGGCPVEDPKVTLPSPLTPSLFLLQSPAEKYNSKTNDLVFGNDIHPEQQIPLSKKRVISTIPKVPLLPSLPSSLLL